ncbi:MAG: ribonuclease P protein component [Eubacteriales bacterium]
METSKKLVTIRENKTFTRLYSRGKNYSGRYIALYCLKGRPDFKPGQARAQKEVTKNKISPNTKTKIGITVSKARGNAVTRNKVRRRLKEAFRQLYPLFGEGYLVVAVARQSAVTAGFSDIFEELFFLLKKAGILKG